MNTDPLPEPAAPSGRARPRPDDAARTPRSRAWNARLRGDTAPAPRRRMVGWMAATAVPACLVLALVICRPRDGIAFGAVQKQLRDFQTLHAHRGATAHGMEMPTIDLGRPGRRRAHGFGETPA